MVIVLGMAGTWVLTYGLPWHRFSSEWTLQGGESVEEITYQINADFSRLSGSLSGEGSGNFVKPYATSFPIYMLGNKVDDITFERKGNFVEGKILLATVKTSDENATYVYEIMLKNFLATEL